jgi:TRAP-type mannitol/chloroaromatic compound transport system permease large subunit
MHPPFGMALYNLRSVAPPEVATGAIYRGAVPFIAIQLAVAGALIAWPDLVVPLFERRTETMAPDRVVDHLRGLPRPDWPDPSP